MLSYRRGANEIPAINNCTAYQSSLVLKMTFLSLMVKLRFCFETVFKNDEKCITCEKEDTGPENHSYQYNVGYFGENDNLGTDKMCVFIVREREFLRNWSH